MDKKFLAREYFKRFIQEIVGYCYELLGTDYSTSLMIDNDNVTLHIHSDKQDQEIVSGIGCFNYNIVEVDRVKRFSEFLEEQNIVKGEYIKRCLELIEQGKDYGGYIEF